jgi:hypothetical protein
MISPPTDERGASPMFTRRFLITGVAASAAAGAVTGIPSAPASAAAKRRLAEGYVRLARSALQTMPRRYEASREFWTAMYGFRVADFLEAVAMVPALCAPGEWPLISGVLDEFDGGPWRNPPVAAECLDDSVVTPGELQGILSSLSKRGVLRPDQRKGNRPKPVSPYSRRRSSRSRCTA